MTGSHAHDADWEQPPGPGRRRTWLIAAVVVAALLTVAAVVVDRARQADTLAVDREFTPPTEGASATDGPVSGGGVALEPLESESRRPGDGPLLPGAPELTVIAGDDRGLRFIDIASGDIRRVEIPRGPDTPVPRPRTMMAVGDALIVSDENRVVRLDLDGERPRAIADAGRAVPTFDDASVWVVEPLRTGLSATAARIRLDGEVVEQVRLPAVARPLAGSADGLIVSVPGGIDMVSGDSARQLTPTGELAATDGRALAWIRCGPDLACQLVLGDLDDPERARLRIGPEELPAGYLGLPRGVFSPDGRLVALPFFRINPRGGLESTDVAIVDVAAGAEIGRAPGTRVDAFNSSAAAWSPDGRWLFVSTGTGLRAWNAETQEISELDVGAGIVRSLVVR